VALSSRLVASRAGNIPARALALFPPRTAPGREVTAEPWTDRRKRLWRVWALEWGGEGIVLKDRRSVYRPGTRSRASWKAKHKLVLPVEVLHCAAELVRWGDWGRACVMAFAYRDPRTGASVTVEQAVRVPHGDEQTPQRGPAEILCWGVLRSGQLRHPQLAD
jgi:hypothetical protein